MATQLLQIVRVVILLTIIQVNCIPMSPCPMAFHYEYNGQNWFGVVEIYPQIYNRFHLDHITMNVTIALFRPVQDFPGIQLYKSLSNTYTDIAERRPIKYRINFPFQTRLPELLKIHVNGVQICRNHMLNEDRVSRVYQWYTLFMPTVDLEDEPFDEYDMGTTFQFNVNSPDPAITNSMLDIPKVIMQRVDEDDTLHSKKQKTNPRWKNRLQATNSQCGTYDKELQYTQLISGGDKIQPGTWPWLVAIFRKDSKASNLAFQCTGSLISNNLVLTAAHCFKSDSKLDPISAKRIVLAFGRHDMRDWTEKNTVISDIEEIILHPDYLSSKESTIFDADIALLVTKDYIAYTSVIKPICLWPESVDETLSVLGHNGTLIGWGQPIENTEKNIPRRLTLPIVKNEFCFPSERFTDTRRVFCAGTERYGYAPCNGDSGSGFAIHANGAWFLRGIVSAALGDPILNRCDLNTYAIFTDIIHFRSWIDEYM